MLANLATYQNAGEEKRSTYEEARIMQVAILEIVKFGFKDYVVIKVISRRTVICNVGRSNISDGKDKLMLDTRWIFTFYACLQLY